MDRVNRLRGWLCSFVLCAFVGFAPAAFAQKEAVRPEVGKPLQAAQAFVKQHKGREALAEVAKAEAVPNRTTYENLLINEMKGSAATLAGDHDTAIRSFEAVLNSGKASGADATRMVQAIAVAYYQKKDYANAAKWTQRYFKEGGNDPSMRTVLLQSYYLGNDCASVSKMLGNGDDESRRPREEDLQILANCYLREKDTAGYVSAIEKLVVYYPKQQYWTDLLARVQKKPGFSDRLGVHVYRLRLATGNLKDANDYMEMAQLALQQGVPAEAMAVMEQGYAKGLLGKGAEAQRQQRLRDLIQKSLDDSQKNRAKDEADAKAAREGDDLVKVGLNYVYEGKADKGLPLIQQGIKKGGLKRPEDAKLRLGEAQLHAGHKQQAVATLKTVQGNDGTADIARLWVLHART